MRRKKGKNRVKVSFLGTVLVLAAITVIVYAFSFNIPSYSVPSNLPPYGGLIGKYAPADSLQVSYDNLTAVRAINASAVPNRQLVNLVQPAVAVHMSAVQAQLEVTLLNPALHINSSARAAVIDGGAFSNVSRALGSSNLVPEDGQGFSIYRVNDSSNGRTKTEWLTLNAADSSVIFAEGGADAKTVMLRMLSVWSGSSPSILSVQNVTRTLYPVGGTNHLALSIRNFTGEVLSGRMNVFTVDVTNQMVELSHVVRFSSSGVASSNVQAVKNVYRFSGDFTKWEECIKATQLLSLTNLQAAVALSGV